MATFTDTVQVNRSPEEAFAFFNDLDRLAKALKNVRKMEAVDSDALRRGSKVRETRLVGGKETTHVLEITAYEPRREFAITSIRGPVSATYRYTLHEQQDGTRIDFRGDIQVRGVLKLLQPMLVNMIKKEDKDILVNIKRLIEERA